MPDAGQTRSNGQTLRTSALCDGVLPVDPTAEPTHNLPRDRTNRSGHFARIDLLPALFALTSEEDDLVSGLDLADIGYVDGDHVHRHGAYDRDAPAANQAHAFA